MQKNRTFRMLILFQFFVSFFFVVSQSYNEKSDLGHQVGHADGHPKKSKMNVKTNIF